MILFSEILIRFVKLSRVSCPGTYASNYETSPVCYFGCKQPIGLHHATICDKFVLPHGKVCSYLRLLRFINQSINQSIKLHHYSYSCFYEASNTSSTNDHNLVLVKDILVLYPELSFLLRYTTWKTPSKPERKFKVVSFVFCNHRMLKRMIWSEWSYFLKSSRV